MVIEAGVIAGYVIAWVLRKTGRVAARLDTEADLAIDSGMDRLHELVTTKLSRDPVVDDLREEAATVEGEISDLTRRRLELAVMAAARKDEVFGQALNELLGRLREAEQTRPSPAAGPRVFTGDARVEATGSGIAFGQVGGDVNIGHAEPRNPS